MALMIQPTRKPIGPAAYLLWVLAIAALWAVLDIERAVLPVIVVDLGHFAFGTLWVVGMAKRLRGAALPGWSLLPFAVLVMGISGLLVATKTVNRSLWPVLFVLLQAPTVRIRDRRFEDPTIGNITPRP